jgi:hypothetical protein
VTVVAMLWLAALAEQYETLRLPLDDAAAAAPLAPAGEDCLPASADFVGLCEAQLDLLPRLVQASGLRASVCAPAAPGGPAHPAARRPKSAGCEQ